MKISKREKVLSGALLVTAFIVWMLSGEGNGVVPGEAETPMVSSGRIFKQYRRIRPLPFLKSEKPGNAPISKRNIFQFGNRTVEIGKNSDLAGSKKGKNAVGMGTGITGPADGKSLSAEPAAPKPPPVDFKVAGIIMAGGEHAAVIVRAPELFVVEESQQFLNHFILKSVKRKGIVIGYTDFKDELFIPLKKDGGLQ